MGIRAQKHLCTLVPRLCENVLESGCRHPGRGETVEESAVKMLHCTDRLVIAEFVGIKAGLGGDHQNHHGYTPGLQIPTDSEHTLYVGVDDLLMLGPQVELLIGEEPVVFPDSDALTALVENHVIDGRPDVGAQIPRRETVVVMILDAAGQFAVKDAEFLGSAVIDKRPQRQHAQTQDHCDEYSGCQPF